MELDHDVYPSISTIPAHAAHSGHHSLPPANALGPQQDLPSYPSSTLQCYYPSAHQVTNYAHISTFSQPFSFHPIDTCMHNFGQMPLPSASQSHIPSFRHTPSIPYPDNIDNQHVSNSPFLDQNFVMILTILLAYIPFLLWHLPNISLYLLLSINFILHPFFAAPCPIPLPPHIVSPPRVPLPHPQIIPNHMTPHVPYVNSSLPSTKDIPLFLANMTGDPGTWQYVPSS